jgi:glycoside/pentoside/hexuronide:cation symporter, GPH family
MFLMQFFTEDVGIAPLAVGVLFLIARIWDAINDPIFGVIVDKCNLKGGKFKPWITMVIYVMPLVTVLLFVNINSTPAINLIYAYIVYILWDTVYTISDVPAFALATVMTDQQKERTKLISMARIGATVAQILTAVVAIPIKMAFGWLPTAILVAVVSLVTMIPLKLYSKERVHVKSTNTISLKELVSHLLHNKYLLIYFGSFILSQLTNTMSLVNYFAIYNLQNEGLISVFFFLMFVPMFICALFMTSATEKFGKKKLVLAGILIFVVSSVAMYFVGYSNIILFIALAFLRSIGMALPMVLTALITTDCVEYGTWKTKKRATGITFSIQTFTTKLTTAVSGGVSGLLLSIIGFKPGQTQTPETLNGIFFLYTLVPAIGFIVMFFIILFKYDLTEAKVNEIIEENKADVYAELETANAVES